MEKFIKYKRIDDTVCLDRIQDILDQIIADGYEIISYSEKLSVIYDNCIDIVIIIGKKQ